MDSGSQPYEARPRFFGGFSFREDFVPDHVWNAFAPAHFILPHFQLTQQGGANWLTLNALLPAGEDPAAALPALGQALAQTLRGRQALLVASTDLSHFYPQANAQELDQAVLRQVEAFDPAGLLRLEDKGKGFACGRGALASVLWAARELGADKTQILHYATSGDVTGDFSQVVGYGAAVILCEESLPS